MGVPVIKDSVLQARKAALYVVNRRETDARLEFINWFFGEPPHQNDLVAVQKDAMPHQPRTEISQEVCKQAKHYLCAEGIRMPVLKKGHAGDYVVQISRLPNDGKDAGCVYTMGRFHFASERGEISVPLCLLCGDEYVNNLLANPETQKHFRAKFKHLVLIHKNHFVPYGPTVGAKMAALDVADRMIALIRK